MELMSRRWSAFVELNAPERLEFKWTNEPENKGKKESLIAITPYKNLYVQVKI